MSKKVMAFINGVGSVLCLFPADRPAPRVAQAPSAQEAIRGDWGRICGDVRTAYALATHEQRREK